MTKGYEKITSGHTTSLGVLRAAVETAKY